VAKVSCRPSTRSARAREPSMLARRMARRTPVLHCTAGYSVTAGVGASNATDVRVNQLVGELAVQQRGQHDRTVTFDSVVRTHGREDVEPSHRVSRVLDAIPLPGRFGNTYPRSVRAEPTHRSRQSTSAPARRTSLRYEPRQLAPRCSAGDVCEHDHTPSKRTVGGAALIDLPGPNSLVPCVVGCPGCPNPNDTCHQSAAERLQP
jgi:hypothetical protein